MKGIRRKQLQRRQAIFMISIVVLMGIVWSIYALSSPISGESNHNFGGSFDSFAEQSRDFTGAGVPHEPQR